MDFKTMRILTVLFGGVIGSALFGGYAQAEGKLTVYCNIQQEACEKVIGTFAQKYHVDAQFVRNSTGSTFSKIKAEKNNPQADVWYGGTIDQHFQAGNLGLLEPYRSPKQAEIMPQLKALTEAKGDLTSVVYMLVLGFGINTEKFAKLGVPEYPKCWRDLLDPRLKGQVQIPDPQLSGTTYTAIATLIQLWNEDKAFDYLKRLDANISEYVKSNQVSASLERGETAVAVGFVHDYAKQKEKGIPIVTVLPCDGDSYSLGGASIIKGARNMHNAKLFIDWVLSKEAQEIPWRESNAYQIPANINAKASPNSIAPQTLTKLIDFDFERFGSAVEGKRLTDKWMQEIRLQRKAQ